MFQMSLAQKEKEIGEENTKSWTRPKKSHDVHYWMYLKFQD